MVEVYARTACATVLYSTVLYSPPHSLAACFLPRRRQEGRKEEGTIFLPSRASRRAFLPC